MLGKGVYIYIYIYTGFQYAGSQNFENNQFSFAGSHKLGITYIIIKKFQKIKINNSKI
jgi:hypothetical protein